MRSASGWGRSSSTRATTTPSRPAPTVVTPSTARPSSLSWSPISPGSPVTGANSCSQDSRTFTGHHHPGVRKRIRETSELRQETVVVAEQFAKVIDSVAHERQAVEAEPEREARPFLWI